MNETSRPEITDPAAYTAAIIEKLGDRDPLASLAAMPGELDRRLERADAEALRVRPFPGKWTPLEILGHLVDTEWTFGFRTRHIVGDDTPDIVGIDQDSWTDRHAHNVRDPRELAGEFAGLRRLNVRFWRSLDETELERAGRHRERGEETLGFMLQLIAGHDLWHLDQLDRYIQEVAAAE